MATNDQRDEQIRNLGLVATDIQTQLRYLNSEADAAREGSADHDRRLVKIETKIDHLEKMFDEVRKRIEAIEAEQKSEVVKSRDEWRKVVLGILGGAAVLFVTQVVGFVVLGFNLKK